MEESLSGRDPDLLRNINAETPFGCKKVGLVTNRLA